MNVFDLVAKLTLDTSEYESGLKEAQSGLSSVGEGMQSVGKSMLPATLAIAGLGTAAVKTAADFETGMSKVKAISGASEEDMVSLSQKAQEMGAKTKFSAREAADAMTYMAMAGWKTEDMMGGIDGIMSLAAASGEDLATTSDIVTDALTAFGLKAEDSGHFADILAAASSNANTNVAMMGETFKYAAPIAGALGFSAEDTAEAIGLMANAGIKASQAGTSLRTIMNNLSGEVKVHSDAMGDMTIETVNADGSMRDLSDILADLRTAFDSMSESEKAANAENIAGKIAMSGFLALVSAAPEDVDKLSSAIANCDGVAGDMADTMQDNLNGQLTIMKSQLEGVAISFGNVLAPAISKIISKIQKFLDWLNSLDEGQRNMIVTIGLVVAAIGPLLIFIGKVATGIQALITVVPIIAGAITGTLIPAIGGFLAAAAPVIGIVAAIAAGIAAVIYVVKHWGEITDWLADKIEEGVEFIKGYLNELWEYWAEKFQQIHDKIVEIFDAIKTYISDKIEAIKSTITEHLNYIKGFFSETWDNIKSAVSEKIDAIKDAVAEKFESMKAKVKAIFTSIKMTVKGKVDDIKTAISDGVQGAIDFLKELPEKALEWGRDLIGNFVQGIKDKVGDVVDAVAGVADTVKDFLGFSEPDRGPLSDFHTYAPDMIDLFAKGIRDNLSEVSSASSAMADAMNPQMPMYSGAVAVAGAGGNTSDIGDIIIPVYIGGNRIDELLVTNEQIRNYRSGGR